MSDPYTTENGQPFLADYVKFNEGNECPTSYHIWSALCLISSVISRKVCIDFDSQRVYPNLYVCLIGSQGLRKSTAKDIAREILEDHFPNIPRAAAVTSKEAITKFMGSDDCLRSFEETKGQHVEYRPLVLFINELKNFLSVNPQGMLDFLTDIYDRKYFDTSYKTAGGEVIINPYLVMLACETPKWIRDKMKTDIISGGFARRLIPVFETEKRCSIPRPYLSVEMKEARQRVIRRLQEVKDLTGVMTWDKDAIEFYDKWYMGLKAPEDAMMEGFYSSKHTQLQKVAICLTAVDYNDLRLRKSTLEQALSLINLLEPNMEKLYGNAGLNPYAEKTDELLGLMHSRGGFISEVEFKRLAFRHMDPTQVFRTIDHLVQSEVIVKAKKKDARGTERVFLFLKDAYDNIITLQAQKDQDAKSAEE